MTREERREVRLAAREARLRERSRSRPSDPRERDPARYTPQDLGIRGGEDIQNAVEENPVRVDDRSVQRGDDGETYLEKIYNDSRGKSLLLAAGYAAETGRCDRAFYLYSVAVAETQVDLQPMASGITPCFSILAADPGAHPELAASLEIGN